MHCCISASAPSQWFCSCVYSLLHTVSELVCRCIWPNEAKKNLCWSSMSCLSLLLTYCAPMVRLNSVIHSLSVFRHDMLFVFFTSAYFSVNVIMSRIPVVDAVVPFYVWYFHILSEIICYKLFLLTTKIASVYVICIGLYAYSYCWLSLSVNALIVYYKFCYKI